MDEPLLLTIDVGSSSLRVLVYDARGRAMPGVDFKTEWRMSTTPDGGATLDAKVLIEEVSTALDHVLQQLGSHAAEIGAVALDTLVSNVLGVEAGGEALTPVFTYADTRNAADAAALRGETGAAAVHDRTGCMIHSSYLPARLRWIQRINPDVFSKVARWVSFGEYLYWHFLGEWRTSYSVASWTGLLNRHTLTWDTEWLGRLGLNESHFSPLGDVSKPLRGLRSPWSARWPALCDVRWFPAVSDGAAANIGSGCDSPSRVALTIGTTGAMRVALEEKIPTVPTGLWSYRVDRRRALLGGATTEGGSVYAWLRETLRLPDPALLDKELGAMEPASHGLQFLPFLSGERAPGWRDDARGVISGLTLNTSPLQIARAGLEAVALRFALIYRLLAPRLAAGHQVIASGSALLASPVWIQIIADVLGRPVTVSAEKESTSRGTAILALEALGHSVAAAALGTTYEPNPRHHAQYQSALQQQSALYDKLFSA